MLEDSYIIVRAAVGSAVFCWLGCKAFAESSPIEAVVWWVTMALTVVFSSAQPIAQQDWLGVLSLALIVIIETTIILRRVASAVSRPIKKS